MKPEKDPESEFCKAAAHALALINVAMFVIIMIGFLALQITKSEDETYATYTRQEPRDDQQQHLGDGQSRPPEGPGGSGEPGQRPAAPQQESWVRR